MSGGPFPIGVGPDVILGIPITSTTLDLTTVVSVTLVARRQDGTTKAPWTASLVAAPGNATVTATAAVIAYPFQTTDLDQKGTWSVSIQLNLIDGNHWWTTPPGQTFTVTDPWGSR